MSLPRWATQDCRGKLLSPLSEDPGKPLSVPGRPPVGEGAFMPESAFPLELGIPLLVVGAPSDSVLPFPAIVGPEPPFSFVFAM